MGCANGGYKFVINTANYINNSKISEYIFPSVVFCHTAFMESYFVEAHASVESIVKFSSRKIGKFSMEKQALDIYRLPFEVNSCDPCSYLI